MAHDYDRDDRDDRRRSRDRDDRDERRPRRARRRYDDDRSEYRTSRKEVSVLGIVALVKGIGALILSLIPCFGMFAIVAAGLALTLAIASILIARSGRQGMGFPVAATAVSGTAVAFSVMWIAMFGAMFRGSEERAERRAPQSPPPPPPIVQPLPRVQPPKVLPPKFEELDKAADERFQKQLLEDLAKDRIKEAIRNGPGLPVTAEKLEADYRTNVVAGETKYKDQVLEVTGVVVRVVREPGKLSYTLELASGELATVKCEFTKQAKHPLASVEAEQKVKVRGLCTGRVNESVQLKDCVLAK